MKTLVSALFFVVASTVGQPTGAQQSPSPEPQQAQPVPCATTSTGQNPSGNHPTIKVPSKLQQAINRQLARVEATTGISPADVATDIQAMTPKPVPCPPAPKAAVLANNPSTQPATPKLPPDATVSLRCNPMAPSSRDSHPTGLYLPDPHDYAPPKPTDFLADSVVPDLAAKTPCFLIRTDPKTQRFFILTQ